MIQLKLTQNCQPFRFVGVGRVERLQIVLQPVLAYELSGGKTCKWDLQLQIADLFFWYNIWEIKTHSARILTTKF